MDCPYHQKNFQKGDQKMKKKLLNRFVSKTILRFICLLVFLIVYVSGTMAQVDRNQDNRIFGELQDTQLGLTGTIRIDRVGTFRFDPREVKTTRRDIFKPGYFSIFDIMVYLDHQGDIQLEYHFDEEMNTHVIDSLNGDQDWWYIAYYDGVGRNVIFIAWITFPIKIKCFFVFTGKVKVP